MTWEVIAKKTSDADWTQVDRMSIGSGFLVRTIWRQHINGDRIDGSSITWVPNWDEKPVAAKAAPVVPPQPAYSQAHSPQPMPNEVPKGGPAATKQ